MGMSYCLRTAANPAALICLGKRIGGLCAFGGVRQNVDESLLLDELDRNDQALLVEETDRTGVHGVERPPTDPKLRSGIVGAFTSLLE